MTRLRVVSNRVVPVTNEEFLSAIFGEEWGKVHVTAFEDDPLKIENDRRGLCWSGASATSKLKTFNPKQNQYFCISLFRPDEEGKPRRRKALFDACFVIVADDVDEKLPIEQVKKLPPPSYKMNSSSNSEQWGWIIKDPCEDRAKVENLLDGLVSKGLAPNGTDPGMKGVTRYVRLPEGSNTKEDRRVEGNPYKCFISEWSPSRLYSMEELASVFDIDLNAPRDEKAGLSASDEVVSNHPIFNHLTVTEIGNDGWVRVDCPNAHNHSTADASGAAVQIQQDGSVHFTCHHGHCQGEKGTDGKKLTGYGVLKLLDEQFHGGKGDFLETVDQYKKELYVKNLRELGGKIPVKKVSSVSDAVVSNEDTPSKVIHFDEHRYIFLAPENKFLDVKTGDLIAPKGLDNLYLQIMPRGRGKVTASEFLFTNMDHDLSSADGVGWHPIGINPPSRENLIFEDEGRRLVNTWKGFAISPIKGDVSIWLDHAEYLFPDEKEREVVLDYLACMVQRVDQKPAFFIAHRGAHRVGKDLFYKGLMRAMGSCARTVDIDDLLASWGDYTNGLKFGVITEVDKAQNKQVSNALKTIVAPTASGKRTLNMKGKGVVTQVDCMGGVMMSNKRSFISIETGDKRYFVVDSWISERNADYYKQIDDWYNFNNGYAKVLDYLLNRDISQFNHNQLPYMTKGALEMVQSGKYDYEQDLEEFEHQNMPPFHMKVILSKDLRKLVKEEGLKCGNNGLDDAMLRMGWKKFAQYKAWEDGKKVAIPTFYAKELASDCGTKDVLEFYQEEFLNKNNFQ